MILLGLKELYPLHSYSKKFPSLRSFLGPKVLRATSAEQAQAALTARKIMAEAQTKSRLRRAIKHQSQKMQSYTYSPRDKVLV